MHGNIHEEKEKGAVDLLRWLNCQSPMNYFFSVKGVSSYFCGHSTGEGFTSGMIDFGTPMESRNETIRLITCPMMMRRINWRWR